MNLETLYFCIPLVVFVRLTFLTKTNLKGM